MPDTFPAREPLPDNGYSESMRGSALKQPLPATPGSVVTNRKTTFSGRSNGSQHGIRTPRSSATSDPASISTERVLGPYWNDACLENSSRLWLPTKTASAASGSNSSVGSSNGMGGRSWFSVSRQSAPHLTNSLRIYSRSSGSFPPECTGSVNTVVKSRRITLYPTPDQKAVFQAWFRASRFVYNRAVEYLKQLDGPRPHWTVVKKTILHNLPDWCRDLPYQVKSIAVRDACRALSAGKLKVKQGIIPRFNLSFRSRKAPKQSCFIPATAIKPGGIYPKLSGQLRYGEELPQQHRDSRLVWEHGDYYLVVTFSAPRQQHTREPSVGVVALDPGVRSFLTFYSPVDCGKLGDQAQQRVCRLLSHLDRLVSRMARAAGQRKRRFRLAQARLRKKIRSLIDELHWKTIRLLTTNYQTILLPKLDTKRLSGRLHRKLRNKSVRAMLGLAHGLFRVRLAHKCQELGNELRYVREDYTSKTCSWSGEIVNIGSKQEIVGSDGIRLDRDVNGARGILLRALVDTPSSFVLEHAAAGM